MSPCLYLDFDGVLHHENVRRVRGVGRPVVSHGSLFEHVPVLEDLLQPYPSLRIVLSTSWVGVLGFNRARAYLPASLRARVIGATTHRHMRMSEPAFRTRGHEVWSDVVRRGVHPRWVAIDDTNDGWTHVSRPHLVVSHPERGLGDAEVAAALAAALEKYCGGPSCFA